jgi:hypothetical protein
MSFLERLKDIIGIDIHHLVNVNVTIINNKDSKDKTLFSEDKKTLKINLAALESREWEELKPALKQSLEEECTTFLETGAEQRVEDIRQKLELKTTKDVLGFYEGKIPSIHYKALEASLYLREAFRSGENIDEMKKDIIHKFGLRGRNICNLCSTGYFEGYLTDLYNEMRKQTGFANWRFVAAFEKIVDEVPFTVFVSQFQGKEQIKSEIDSKLTKFHSYGIGYLAVHGIGADNVRKIQEIIKEITEKRTDIKTEMSIESGNIKVEIMFKKGFEQEPQRLE